MKKVIRDYVFLLALAGIIVILDQWTKYLVVTQIPMGGLWSPWPWLTPYARIVHWSNTGAAFGMFQGFGGVFTILAIIVSLAILYYFPRVPRQDWPLRLAMVLQLAGAVGNLIDRLRQGYVTDFVSVGNFAVFNVADASISIGVAVLILGLWIKEQQEKKVAAGNSALESSIAEGETRGSLSDPGQPSHEFEPPAQPLPPEQRGE